MPVVSRLRVAWLHAAPIESKAQRASTVAVWAWQRVAERFVDERYRRQGLKTAGPDFALRFDADDESIGYVPSSWRVLRTLFPKGSLGPNDVLLEYGSGKGRVSIWAASQFPLRRVIGVEVDPGLSATALDNLRKWHGATLCKDVEFVCVDAREYQVPDDVTVVYFFNPFMGDIFRDVVTNICVSLARRPRPLRIVYVYPIMHELLVEAGFTLKDSRRHVFNAWATYEFVNVSEPT